MPKQSTAIIALILCAYLPVYAAERGTTARTTNKRKMLVKRDRVKQFKKTMPPLLELTETFSTSSSSDSYESYFNISSHEKLQLPPSALEKLTDDLIREVLIRDIVSHVPEWSGRLNCVSKTWNKIMKEGAIQQRVLLYNPLYYARNFIPLDTMDQKRHLLKLASSTF